MSVPTQAGAALPPPLPLHVRTHRLALPHNGFHIFIKDVSQAPHASSAAAAAAAPRPTLVVVHGGPGLSDHTELLPLITARPGGAFDAGFGRVVFYDQLGCGQSDQLLDAGCYSLQAYACELAAVLAWTQQQGDTAVKCRGEQQQGDDGGGGGAHGLPAAPVVVMGHSWGGQVVLEYLLTCTTAARMASGPGGDRDQDLKGLQDPAPPAPGGGGVREGRRGAVRLEHPLLPHNAARGGNSSGAAGSAVPVVPPPAAPVEAPAAATADDGAFSATGAAAVPGGTATVAVCHLLGAIICCAPLDESTYAAKQQAMRAALDEDTRRFYEEEEDARAEDGSVGSLVYRVLVGKGEGRINGSMAGWRALGRRAVAAAAVGAAAAAVDAAATGCRGDTVAAGPAAGAGAAAGGGANGAVPVPDGTGADDLVPPDTGIRASHPGVGGTGHSPVQRAAAPVLGARPGARELDPWLLRTVPCLLITGTDDTVPWEEYLPAVAGEVVACGSRAVVGAGDGADGASVQAQLQPVSNYRHGEAIVAESGARAVVILGGGHAPFVEAGSRVRFCGEVVAFLSCH